MKTGISGVFCVNDDGDILHIRVCDENPELIVFQVGNDDTNPTFWIDRNTDGINDFISFLKEELPRLGD